MLFYIFLIKIILIQVQKEMQRDKKQYQNQIIPMRYQKTGDQQPKKNRKSKSNRLLIKRLQQSSSGKSEQTQSQSTNNRSLIENSSQKAESMIQTVPIEELHYIPPQLQPLEDQQSSMSSQQAYDNERRGQDQQHMSLKQIRAEIDSLFWQRQHLQLTKMNIRSSNQKKKLERMINEKNPLIKKLSELSRQNKSN